MNAPPHSDLDRDNLAVVVNFQYGTFESGFFVVARILKDGKRVEQREAVQIPAVPELAQLYADWKHSYLAQGQAIGRDAKQSQSIELETRQIEIPAAQVHHASLHDCLGAADRLCNYLRQEWFESWQFQTLKEWIKGRSPSLSNTSLPIFFEFETGDRDRDVLLRRLPWSSWDLFSELSYAEATLGIAYAHPVPSHLKNIKVLAVFGSDEGGIDLESDRHFVNQLQQCGAEIDDLSRPEPNEFDAKLVRNPYDLLFFAGHSYTQDHQQDGELLLKPGTFISIDDLLPGLQVAVQNGLKLAIFNSCDGLGLANKLLTKTHIPAVVVFREPVPDEVARCFLQYFLQEFSSGTPLFLCARKARNQLRFLEKRSPHPLPCASWLPVVCQNPSQSELIWIRENELVPPPPLPLFRKDLLWNVGTTAIALTSLVIVIIALKTREDSPTPIPFLVEPSSETKPKSAVISRGEKLILTLETNDAKIAGIEAYEVKNWEAAIAAFRESLHQQWEENQTLPIKSSLDPETLIYLNNAIAEHKAQFNFGQLVPLAIAVPAKDTEGERLLSKDFLQGAGLRQAEFNCGVNAIVAAIENLNTPLNCQSEDSQNFIHLTIANDRSDEQLAEAVAIELSKLPVVGVVGHFSSGACLNSGKIYEKFHIPMISPTCTSTKLSGFSDYFFRTIPNDAEAARGLWSKVGSDSAKVAIAYSRNSEYTESFKAAFAEQLPDRKYRYICDDLADNFYAPGCAEQTKKKEANFLLLVPTTTETLNAALSILPHLEPGIVPLGSDSVYGRAILDSEEYSKKAVETGLQIYVSWHPGTNPDDRTDFEQNATRLFDFEDWNWHHQSAYDALSAFAQGVRDLDGDLSGGKLMKRLHAPDFAADGVAGEKSVKFLRSGDRDLTGFEDKIGTIVRVLEENNENGETRYRFGRVEDLTNNP